MNDKTVIRTSKELSLLPLRVMAAKERGEISADLARDILEGLAHETCDQRWIRQARGTLDKLYAFLQAKNVPHAVDTREWIDNALRVLDAYEPTSEKADDGLNTG